MGKDALGNRMKMYEGKETSRRFMPLLPIIARLDGRSFSKFTQGLERPYDIRMTKVMQATTKWLVDKTGACVGYTQSDEITLVFNSDEEKSEVFFAGKIFKMTSTLAAMASVHFNSLVGVFIPEKKHLLPTFDCRVWQVPNKVEAVNAVLWREYDATKNSIQMAAHHYYSHNQLMNKHTGEMQEMLFQKGVNWNDYPVFFKRGSYFQRRKEITKFSQEELERLPAKHAARQNPDLEILRTKVKNIDMPPLGRVVNRIEVIFDGQDPITETADGQQDV